MKKFTLINCQPVLKHLFFLNNIQQQTKKLYNPAFILILRSLKLDERLVMNKYVKVAVQSTNTEQAQQKQRSRGSSASTALLLSTEKPSSTISSSKSSKRRTTRRTVADSERERAAQKTKREEIASEEEDSESYDTPENISDSATTEKTKTKTKNGKITPAEEKLLKTKFTNKGPELFGSVQNLKEEAKISRSKVKRFLHISQHIQNIELIVAKHHASLWLFMT